MDMQAIGHINSCFQERFATPRQGVLSPSSRARLKLCNQRVGEGALEGLKAPSYLWLIWRFETKALKEPLAESGVVDLQPTQVANYRSQAKTKIKPPRLEGKKLGVFASRSPHRPNPIGLSLVKVEAIGSNWLELSGVDLIDGTAVLDIKPYIADYDSPPQNNLVEVATSETVAPVKSFRVSILEPVRTQVERWCSEGIIPHPKELVLNTLLESLSLDPRPLAYRRPLATSGQIKDHFVCKIFAVDWHFRYVDNEEIEVYKALLLNGTRDRT